jgi:long-chain acyl-CoA synthetase
MPDLGSFLRINADRTPNRPALFCGESTLSHELLDYSSTLLAKWLLASRLEPGQRVAVHWTNSIPVVQLFYGIFKAGLVAVPINARLKPPEIAFILRHAEARACFSEPALFPLAQEAGGECSLFEGLPELNAVESTSLPAVDSDRTAILLYTSGTTARPKGVTHTHRSLYETGLNTQRLMAVHEPLEDRALCVLPLTHIGAFVGMLASLIGGGSMALLPRFDPAAFLDTLERFQCTSVVCMPALLHLVLTEQLRQPRIVSSLQVAIGGGDSVPIPLQEAFQTAFGVPLREAYGMTESVPLTGSPTHAIRPGSFGLPLEGVSLRLVDPAGCDVPPGHTGEILSFTAATCSGYWNDPEATRAAFLDGWFRTGDLASCDSEGYYWFQGRKKEIIIRAGSNISPQEVEAVLYRHPAVAEAGVVGEFDPVCGERVVAFITLREGAAAEAEELCAFGREYLADYKCPEKVIFLPSLPKTPTGKVSRRTLKESMQSAVAVAHH